MMCIPEFFFLIFGGLILINISTTCVVTDQDCDCFTVFLLLICQLFNTEYKHSPGILCHFHLLSNQNVNRVTFT